MKNLVIIGVLASLLGVSVMASFADASEVEAAANYDCQLSVFAGQATHVQNFKFQLPGPVEVTFAGIQARVFSSTDGRLNVRVSQEGKPFPYAYGMGAGFPESVGTVLATGSAVASALHCDKNK